jgi:hypothetical protein
MLSEVLGIAVLGPKLSHHDGSVVADLHLSVNELATVCRMPQALMKPEGFGEPIDGALEILIK